MSETLAFKPCPFCGGTDIRVTNHGKISSAPFHQDDSVFSMCCYRCGAQFPNCYRASLFVELWNRRAPDPLTERLAGALTEAVEVTVVGARCVYINKYRVAGRKPYVSEDLPEHTFNVTVKDILEAFPKLFKAVTQTEQS